MRTYTGVNVCSYAQPGTTLHTLPHSAALSLFLSRRVIMATSQLRRRRGADRDVGEVEASEFQPGGAMEWTGASAPADTDANMGSMAPSTDGRPGSGIGSGIGSGSGAGSGAGSEAEGGTEPQTGVEDREKGATVESGAQPAVRTISLEDGAADLVSALAADSATAHSDDDDTNTEPNALSSRVKAGCAWVCRLASRARALASGGRRECERKARIRQRGAEEAWEGWAANHLPRRGSSKRTVALCGLMAIVVLVLTLLVSGVVAAVYAYRGNLLLHLGGTLQPEEAIRAGLRLDQVVDPTRMPRNIEEGDSEDVKLRKLQRHEASRIVPDAHLPFGCEADLTRPRFQVRAGMIGPAATGWEPWPTIAPAAVEHDYLRDVLPVQCSDPQKAHNLTLLSIVTRAHVLMAGLKQACIAAPQLGINSTFVVLRVAGDDDGTFGDGQRLFVALNPVLEPVGGILGIAESLMIERDEVCADVGTAPERWRSITVVMKFRSAEDLEWYTIQLNGPAAAAAQHCTDFFIQNPCIA